MSQHKCPFKQGEEEPANRIKENINTEGSSKFMLLKRCPQIVSVY
jgi:hypothetical protein